MNNEYPEEFLARLRSVKNRRAKVVIEHILTHGSITTEQITSIYGYNHPPRAARDVRDEGIPLETIQVKNAEGGTIAAYRFGDPAKVTEGRLGGRKTFPKKTQGSPSGVLQFTVLYLLYSLRRTVSTDRPSSSLRCRRREYGK